MLSPVKIAQCLDTNVIETMSGHIMNYPNFDSKTLQTILFSRTILTKLECIDP